MQLNGDVFAGCAWISASPVPMNEAGARISALYLPHVNGRMQMCIQHMLPGSQGVTSITNAPKCVGLFINILLSCERLVLPLDGSNGLTGVKH